MFRWLYNPSAEKFPALTGLRAIAAYLVFFHHFTPDASLVSAPLAKFLGEGHVGVTLFYVLSGFLITYNYEEKARGLSRRFWKQYMIRRFARIYPLYLFLLSITFLWPVVVQHGPMADARTLFLNFTLLKGFFANYLFSGIAPSWSLTVEETFYAMAPFLFLLVRKWHFAGVQVVLYAVGATLLFAGSHIHFYGFFGNFQFVALYTFFGRSFEFLAGMSLARLLLANPGLLHKPRPALFTWLGGIGCAAVVAWLSLLSEPNLFGLFHPIGMALNNFALPLFVCILFCGLIAERTILGRVLGSSTFVLLGRASYAFYLVHFGILANLVQIPIGRLPQPWRLVAFFAAVNAISIALYIIVEHPANEFIRRWAEPARHRTARHKTAPLASRESARAATAAPQLRRYALAWSALFLLTFGTWSVINSAKVIAGTATNAGAIIPLGPLVSTRTNFGVVTSRVGDVPRLTYRVGNVPVSPGKFIFAHANSMIKFDVSRQRSSVFDFSAGLDDVGGQDAGTVVYVVKGDGQILFESPVVRALEPPKHYSVNVTGVRILELVITDAGDGIDSDEAYWIDPVLH